MIHNNSILSTWDLCFFFSTYSFVKTLSQQSKEKKIEIASNISTTTNTSNSSHEMDNSMNSKINDISEVIDSNHSLNNEPHNYGDANSFEIRGRRIVDIKYFINALQSIKHEGFNCSFSDLILVSEKRIREKSIFFVSMQCLQFEIRCPIQKTQKQI